MRRRGARHRARPPRALGAARGAAHRLRRVARRQQGEQHGQGGAALRARGQGLQEGAAGAARPVTADDRALELQPLRGARGLQEGQGAAQRSRLGAARGHRGGARPVVHRRRAHLRADAGALPRRRAAAAHRRPETPPRRFRGGGGVRAPGRPGAGAARARGAGVLQDLRRQRAARGARRVAAAAAAGDGADRPGGRRAHLAAAGLPAAPGDQDGAGRLGPLPLARAAAADRVLQPALRRRHRHPRGDQRPGGAAPLARPRDLRPGGGDDRLLRPGHGALRPGADAGRRAGGVGERRRPALGVAQARRRQPPRAPGPRQALRHGDRRPADDRDPEGDRRRVGLLRALGRLPGEGGQRPPAARALHPGARRRAAAPRRGQHRARSSASAACGSWTAR